LHVFPRPDPDPDCHDHPWHYHTFPLVSYVEDVWEHGLITKRVVLAGRWSYKEATHCHRVAGPHWQPFKAPHGLHVRNMWNVIMPTKMVPWYTWLCWRLFGAGTVVTIMHSGPEIRKWGFMQRVGATFVWVPWKQYVNRAKTWME
jgi:hypothetical protein